VARAYGTFCPWCVPDAISSWVVVAFSGRNIQSAFPVFSPGKTSSGVRPITGGLVNGAIVGRGSLASDTDGRQWAGLAGTISTLIKHRTVSAWPKPQQGRRSGLPSSDGSRRHHLPRHPRDCTPVAGIAAAGVENGTISPTGFTFWPKGLNRIAKAVIIKFSDSIRIPTNRPGHPFYGSTEPNLSAGRRFATCNPPISASCSIHLLRVSRLITMDI